jgi:hypothetical protein
MSAHSAHLSEVIVTSDRSTPFAAHAAISAEKLSLAESVIVLKNGTAGIHYYANGSEVLVILDQPAVSIAPWSALIEAAHLFNYRYLAPFGTTILVVH